MILAIIKKDAATSTYALDVTLWIGGVFSGRKTAIKKLEKVLGDYGGCPDYNWYQFGYYEVKFVRLRKKNNVNIKNIERFCYYE